MEEEKKVGQPTKYREEYCKALVDHMAKGFSYTSFGAVVNVGKTTLYEWEKSHEEWAKAKKVAVQKAMHFFESRLIAKISGIKYSDEKFNSKNIDTSCLIFALKTRFHETYGEKQKIDQTISQETIQINIDGDDKDL